MSHGLRYTPDQVADIIERRLGVVGTANMGDTRLSDIPVLEDAIMGPGSLKPPRIHGPRETRPYYQLLMGLLREYDIPAPIPEYRFDEKRKWRFDFAWPKPVAVALELDGGLFINGAHNRGKALLAQYEKSNAAVLQGWRILRYSPQQLTQAAEAIREIFGR